MLAPVRALDRLQRRHAVLAVPIAVLKKFGDDQGGSLSAVIAYYAFFSLFPLLMVFVAVLGFVLEGNPERATGRAGLHPEPDPDRRR